MEAYSEYRNLKFAGFINYLILHNSTCVIFVFYHFSLFSAWFGWFINLPEELVPRQVSWQVPWASNKYHRQRRLQMESNGRDHQCQVKTNPGLSWESASWPSNWELKLWQSLKWSPFLNFKMLQLQWKRRNFVTLILNFGGKKDKIRK